MSSETFERATKRSATGGAGGVGVKISSSTNANSIAGSGGVVGSSTAMPMTGSEKRPIRPKLLKLSDVTIPHRNRKKTKTKSKDRSMSSVRDRIYDDPAYTDDISHLANPIRRSSVNLSNTEQLTVGSTKGSISGSSSLGNRSKLTREFQKLAQEDIGHIAFSSSEEDLRYNRAPASRIEGSGRGRSLERSNAVLVDQPEKIELKRRNEKRPNKQKRNLSLDNKRQHSQQESKENEERERDKPPEPPQRLALTRYNLGKQRSDEAAWQRQQSQMEFASITQDNEDIFSLHSSAKENLSVAAASTSASLSNASTSKMQMGKRFLKGEIGIKSFNYYLLKEGLKSSKKFVEKQKSNFQASTALNSAPQNVPITGLNSATIGEAPKMPISKSKLQANSEENIYEEIFFKDAPANEKDDENQNPSNANKTVVSAGNADQNVIYPDCELCMQQCDKADCEYCLQSESSGNVNQNRTTIQNFNNSAIKTNTNAGNLLMPNNLNNNTSSRTSMENQLNTAPILEFQSYNPNNPGVYKIETTPVAITGDYNPILQFQQPSTQQQPHSLQHQQQQHSHVQHQSTSNTSTATTTPSDHNLHQHHAQQQQQQQHQLQQHQQIQQNVQQQQQQQQQFGGYKQQNFYTPNQIQQNFWSQTSTAPRPRTYMVTSHFPGGVTSMQRMNTKSSSSSDSLQQHKFNTFAHLDANFYNSINTVPIANSSELSNNYLPPQPLQPLMYAASRRLGGSQILVDNSYNIFENPPQIYKSDSRASILSEYSLSRSSDTCYAGGKRYGHNRPYGTSHLNDQSNFENSLMSSYATANQRRYFGSAESCRFGYDCRRCSLDSGAGPILLANSRVFSAGQQNNSATGLRPNDKCNFSDHCKYDCRNCDCSSVYFSSDFDDIYSGGGIPRKTAKGTLPSTGGQPPPPALENYDITSTNNEKQQALKQNKYAQDFFKHVNDVKRSIYQAEMQRNGNMESMSPKKTLKKEAKEKDRENNKDKDKEILGTVTLPLAKERCPKPTPAPRTSLQQQQQSLGNNGQLTPQPLQRHLPVKTNELTVEKKEYASLDRLIASNKGAIPKGSTTNRISPSSSPKARSTITAGETKLESTNHEQEKRYTKKHPKESSKITSSSLAVSLSTHRRKDVPAPPPPSPATYADLQELQLNMQDTMRDDTKHERKRKRKQHDEGNEHENQQELGTPTNAQRKDEEGEQPQQQQQQQEEQQLPEVHKQTETFMTTAKVQTKEGKTMNQHKATENNTEEGKLATKDATNNETVTGKTVTENNAIMPHAPNAKKDAEKIQLVTEDNETSSNTSHMNKGVTEADAAAAAPYISAQTQTSFSSITLVSVTSVSSSIVNAQDSQQRDQLEIYDDDVFYDARSEDSACTAATSSSMASKSEQHKLEQQQPLHNEQLQQQQQSSNKTFAEIKCQESEQELKQQVQGQNIVAQEKYFENVSIIHQQDNTLEDQQQPEYQNLESEGQTTENEQLQQEQSQSICHKINEPLQAEQQMNKNEVKKENNNSNSNNNRENKDNDVQDDDYRDGKVFKDKENINHSPQTADTNNVNTTNNTFTITNTTEQLTATSTNTNAKVELKEVVAGSGGGETLAVMAGLELKVNKDTKKKQEINENNNNNKRETTTTTAATINNNNDSNFITKDNEKPNKTDKRETKRISKNKRDYLHDEERREMRLKQQQQQHSHPHQQQQQQIHKYLDVEKPTTTVITPKLTSVNTSSSSSLTKKHRSQKRSPSSPSDYNKRISGGDQPHYPKIPTSTLSCDTCCQLEWSQHHDFTNLQTQQQSPQTLKPPTLHIGMAGQPARVSKRKNSSSSGTSKERASKTKQQEIKTKIIYSKSNNTHIEKAEKFEKSESRTNNNGGKSLTKETGLSTTKTNKTKDIEEPEQSQSCSVLITTTNVAETLCELQQTTKVDEQPVKENNDNDNDNKLKQQPDILKEIKQISKAIVRLQHEAESSDTLTLENDTTSKEQHVAGTNSMPEETASTKTKAQTIAAAEANSKLDNIMVKQETEVKNVDKNNDAADTAATTNAAVDAAAAAAVEIMSDSVANNNATNVNITANDSKSNTTNISCNSEFAGVTTHSPHNSSSPVVPLITTIQSSLSQESDTRRPPLQRQDYSCLDSSEAQSDDSHLTRDSITRESQNDELSSSTLDKIDVSTLPLPALPPKKRRTKLRASPSKHHHCRSRHESPQKLLHQQELRDPYGTGEKQQIASEDTKHLSAFQQYAAKRRESLEASTRSFNEKLESRRMHYHMGGGGGGGGGGVPTGNSATATGAGIHMPTYLFGDQYYSGHTSGSSRKSMVPSSKEEIYLNKSGWVQVNTKRANDENRGYRRANYNHQNGDLRNAIRVIQIDNTRRSDMARQALLQHQHSMLEPPKFVSSKVEELIQRNEARLGNNNSRDLALRPGYRILDPQLASILNERPGFLPVKNLNDRDSPPPITPILSPPPAFQDSSAKIKCFDRRRTVSSRLTPQLPVLQPQTIINNSNLQATNGVNSKGMVFSRSFEYDNRRPTPTDAYVETFSRSFDGNLTERVTSAPMSRDRSPNFSTLTGNSPNYLTKKDSGGGSSGSLKSRDSSPKYQSPVASISSVQSPQTQKTTAYLNTSVKEAPPSYSVASVNAQKYSPRSTRHERSFDRSKSHNVLGRSRKSQFSRSGSGSTAVMANSMGVSRFRSFDTTASQRLNSCDSGARSDLSNDELDIEEDDNGSSEFLNTNSYNPATSPFKTQRQRSLTPDRNESHSSSSSLRKQRSITPESRSLTPEDRRKKGSQVSLSGSRQNSSSRSNTLERKHEKVNISRSSSSSSYSGREHDNYAVGSAGSGITVMDERAMRLGLGGMNVSGGSQHRRSLGRNAKQVDEHRIRRSRSLQLTERSPNRGHKMVVCVGQNHANVVNQTPIYQQANTRLSNFLPTIRTSGKSQSILINNLNGSVAGSGTRQRQSDIDKSRSFDFDYCNYNATTSNIKAPHSNSSLLSTQNLISREAALRLDFDKSRSFDEDYREAVVTNNNLNANAMRYLQANETGERNHVSRLRRSSPVEGNGRNTRSPQSSGSSCNNLNVPRSNTSPQNYGTRLCDHEMTYDLMRKSLDRSPIMDFRRGDSAGGDYDIPVAMLRNRETINSGGNSELNFMNADVRLYEQHLASNSLKHQRSLRRTHSPNETHYSLERSHNAGSRDDITPQEPNEYRNEYNDLYRRTRTSNRGSDLFKSKTTANFPLNTTNTTTNLSTKIKSPLDEEQLTQQCSYWPQCGACQNLQSPNYEYLKSLPIKRKKNSLHNQVQQHSLENVKDSTEETSVSATATSSTTANTSIVKICVNKNEQKIQKQQDDTSSVRPIKSTTQWTLLCKNAMASKQPDMVTSLDIVNTLLTNANNNKNTTNGNTNIVVNVKTSSSPLLSTTLSAPPCTPLLVTAETSKSTATAAAAPAIATTTATTLTNTTNAISPKVIPLAATSLVFLGDFEMPITRQSYNKTAASFLKISSTNNKIYEENKISAKNMPDNLKRFITNTIIPATTINEKETRKSATNNFWTKNSKTFSMMTMRKITENEDDNDGNNVSSSSVSSGGSHEGTSFTNSCSGSGSTSDNNKNYNRNTRSMIQTIKSRQNLEIKSGFNQKHCRYTRLSLPNIWLNAAAVANKSQENIEKDNENIKERYTPTTTTTPANYGINVIGLRNGFSTILSQQIRAVSSPSLTIDNAGSVTEKTNDNNILVHQRLPSSNSSYNTASHEVCQTATTATTNAASTSTNTRSSTTASQNVGVLQKFKRTLTNFNRHQQPSATSTNQITANNSTMTSTTTTATTDNSTFLMSDNEMQTDVVDGCSNSAGSGNGNGVSNKYRFGPLVWRTSKERRKTKYNRRDKCNSGDSGIQIELENDEQFAKVLASNSNVGGGGGGGNMINSAEASATSVKGSLFNMKQEGGMNSLRVRSVRRTNSAKVSTIIDDESKSTITTATQISKANILKRIDMHNEREAPESLPTRSLSQPNGLESCGMTRNDLDDSDSDSVTSHEEASNYYPIYAEVLYNFTAAGPQELGLEKGTLIEILRKEIGPWWFGRIKKEDASLVEEILDPELGWFPKEFVRVIHSPETDFFYLQHMDEQQQHEQSQPQQQQNDTTHINNHESTENKTEIGNQTMTTSSSVPCALVNSCNSGNNIGDNNCNTTVIDQHNVTTIVIESSASSSLPPSSAAIIAPQFVAIENKSSNDTTSTTCLTVHHTASTSSCISSGNSSGQTVLSSSQSLNVIMDSADILRRSAVKELLDTEVNYVKLLSAICEGYLPAMSKRIDIFSPNSIRLIFSNITAIYKFQRRFLDALRKGIEQNQVAKVFLKMHKGFLCYSTYCNSYPRALIELASYERVKDARTILDNCRELENLAELPLSAHLLAPVQRICRYPLHLGEIIKSSTKGVEPPAFSLSEFEQIDVSQLDIPDTTETIDMALEAMKSVTEAVNEGKRHSETIARHQASFQNFKGPPLHLHSTRFFLQIDATRQKQNLWNSSCTLFLFDNQLVYCKRDIIKRSNFIYKGRIFLDRCRVVNVRDGKMFGHTIKNSLRIYCEARDKWFDFSFRSANRKHRFLNTLALERQFGGKSLYISEMTGFEYAFDERDYSDQSDYEGGDSGELKLKEFLYETNSNTDNNINNTSGESSVPESPAKAFKYSDTLPHKKSQRLDTTLTTTGANDNQTGSLGRRRLGNWFRKPKSSASTPNHSPTHKPTHSAYSTGDLQLSGTTEATETYTVVEHHENGGVSS